VQFALLSFYQYVLFREDLSSFRMAI
jgi:hypothetical protein